MHLKQPKFTYSACGLFTKNKERIQKVKETGDSIDKACFQLDMAYGDLARRTTADKILRDKAFNITKGPKYDLYKKRLAFMVYKFF